MFRGFLNEIKNVAVNRATNRINTMMNNALGGVPGLPMNRGRVSTARNSFGSPNPFDGQIGYVHYFRNIAIIQKKKNFYKSNMSHKNSVYLGMIKKRKDFDLKNFRDIKNYLRYFLSYIFSKFKF